MRLNLAVALHVCESHHPFASSATTAHSWSVEYAPYPIRIVERFPSFGSTYFDDSLDVRGCDFAVRDRRGTHRLLIWTRRRPEVRRRGAGRLRHRASRFRPT